MNNTRPSRFLCKAAALTATIGLAVVTHTWAHAFLDHSEPAVGSTAKQAPGEVWLAFTEKLETSFSRIQVFDASGKEVDKKDVRADAKDAHRLGVSLPTPLGAGVYKVVWRAVAQDTHVTQGDFTFRVQP